MRESKILASDISGMEITKIRAASSSASELESSIVHKVPCDMLRSPVGKREKKT
jgi:hypothetical protein